MRPGDDAEFHAFNCTTRGHAQSPENLYTLRGSLTTDGPSSSPRQEQLRAESEGKGTPTWRERLQAQVNAIKDTVMTGQLAPFYTWDD